VSCVVFPSFAAVVVLSGFIFAVFEFVLFAQGGFAVWSVVADVRRVGDWFSS
jgi:hypothetical protein